MAKRLVSTTYKYGLVTIQRTYMIFQMIEPVKRVCMTNIYQPQVDRI